MSRGPSMPVSARKQERKNEGSIWFMAHCRPAALITCTLEFLEHGLWSLNLPNPVSFNYLRIYVILSDHGILRTFWHGAPDRHCIHLSTTPMIPFILTSIFPAVSAIVLPGFSPSASILIENCEFSFGDAKYNICPIFSGAELQWPLLVNDEDEASRAVGVYGFHLEKSQDGSQRPRLSRQSSNQVGIFTSDSARFWRVDWGFSLHPVSSWYFDMLNQCVLIDPDRTRILTCHKNRT